jgi:phosphoheptose isomerase
MKQRIKDHIERSLNAKQRILEDDTFIAQLEEAAVRCAEAIKQGKKSDLRR